jgi:hypothetical protein
MPKPKLNECGQILTLPVKKPRAKKAKRPKDEVEDLIENDPDIEVVSYSTAQKMVPAQRDSKARSEKQQAVLQALIERNKKRAEERKNQRKEEETKKPTRTIIVKPKTQYKARTKHMAPTVPVQASETTSDDDDHDTVELTQTELEEMEKSRRGPIIKRKAKVNARDRVAELQGKVNMLLKQAQQAKKETQRPPSENPYLSAMKTIWR